MVRIVLVLICMAGPLLAQDSLTVQDIVRQALRDNPAVQQTQRQVDAARARVEISRSALSPNVSFEGTYERIGPVPAIQFGPSTFTLYPENNYDAHVGARYTVYDFGRNDAGVHAAESKVASTGDLVDVTTTNVTYAALKYFYSILFLRQTVELADEQIRTFTQHLSLAQKKLDAGTATSFDVLTTRVRVAGAEKQKVDLENSLHQQETLLRQLLGYAPGQPLPLKGSFASVPDDRSADSLTSISLRDRRELRQARDSKFAATAQLNFVHRGDLPTISVNGMWGLKNGFIPNLNPLHGNWALGAALEIPIYDGQRVSHMEEEASAQIESEQARINDIERQVKADVERAVNDRSAALKKISIAEIQTKQAHEAFVVAQIRYQTGSGTNVDLLDAETNESAARLNQIQAMYEYVMANFEVKRAIGAQPF